MSITVCATLVLLASAAFAAVPDDPALDLPHGDRQALADDLLGLYEQTRFTAMARLRIGFALHPAEDVLAPMREGHDLRFIEIMRRHAPHVRDVQAALDCAWRESLTRHEADSLRMSMTTAQYAAANAAFIEMLWERYRGAALAWALERKAG